MRGGGQTKSVNKSQDAGNVKRNQWIIVIMRGRGQTKPVDNSHHARARSNETSG